MGAGKLSHLGQGYQLMKSCKLSFASLAVLGLMALSPAAAHALLVKVSINSGPTIVGPDNGTLVVTANPGDILRITWALGADSSIGVYRGLVSSVDTAEISRFGPFALELTGQGFDPAGNPNAPFPGGDVFYNAWSDGAPIGFAGNGGELWRIDYIVTNPVTDAGADISFGFDEVFQCSVFPAGACPGTPGTASLRIDAVPEPTTLLLLGSGLTAFATTGRRVRR
jgi:hypothetical protein